MLDAGVTVEENFSIFGRGECDTHGAGRFGCGTEEVLDEVDVDNGGIGVFKGADEVVTGFNKGVGEFGAPEKEEAIRKVGYKNG